MVVVLGVWVNAGSVRGVSVRDVQAVEDGPFTPGEPPKRVEGIEPSSLAWKAIALPLSYTRAGMRLGSAGFEPAKAEAIRFTV